MTAGGRHERDDESWANTNRVLVGLDIRPGE